MPAAFRLGEDIITRDCVITKPFERHPWTGPTGKVWIVTVAGDQLVEVYALEKRVLLCLLAGDGARIGTALVVDPCLLGWRQRRILVVDDVLLERALCQRIDVAVLVAGDVVHASGVVDHRQRIVLGDLRAPVVHHLEQFLGVRNIAHYLLMLSLHAREDALDLTVQHGAHTDMGVHPSRFAVGILLAERRFGIRLHLAAAQGEVGKPISVGAGLHLGQRVQQRLITALAGVVVCRRVQLGDNLFCRPGLGLERLIAPPGKVLEGVGPERLLSPCAALLLVAVFNLSPGLTQLLA